MRTLLSPGGALMFTHIQCNTELDHPKNLTPGIYAERKFVDNKHFVHFLNTPIVKCEDTDFWRKASPQSFVIRSGNEFSAVDTTFCNDRVRSGIQNDPYFRLQFLSPLEVVDPETLRQMCIEAGFSSEEVKIVPYFFDDSSFIGGKANEAQSYLVIARNMAKS